MISQEFKQYLESEGYFDIKEIPNRGICALFRFVFTTGLVYGIHEWGYSGRYCYSSLSDAKEALDKWNGLLDPQDDIWIKHKGEKGEYSNPKNKII